MTTVKKFFEYVAALPKRKFCGKVLVSYEDGHIQSVKQRRKIKPAELEQYLKRLSLEKFYGKIEFEVTPENGEVWIEEERSVDVGEFR